MIIKEIPEELKTISIKTKKKQKKMIEDEIWALKYWKMKSKPCNDKLLKFGVLYIYQSTIINTNISITKMIIYNYIFTNLLI